jgi:hypothetical protein
MSLPVRVLLLELFRNLTPRCHPHTFLLAYILGKLLQSCKSSWLSYNATMKTDGHHLSLSLLSFLVQYIECIFEVVEESLGVSKAVGTVKFEVIVVIGVGQEKDTLGVGQVFLVVQINPVGDVICIGIRCPLERFTELLNTRVSNRGPTKDRGSVVSHCS